MQAGSSHGPSSSRKNRRKERARRDTNAAKTAPSNKQQSKQQRRGRQQEQTLSSRTSNVATSNLDEGSWLASIGADDCSEKRLENAVAYIIKFQLVQEHAKYQGQLYETNVESLGPVIPSGKRQPDQGVEDEEQGILLIELNEQMDVVINITQLVAGFIIGPEGVSIREISRATGCHMKSWTIEKESVRSLRSFILQGDTQSVLYSLDVMLAAIGRYKELAEGSCRGKSVKRIQRIKGLDFFYYPPPKTKIPYAASIQGPPQGGASEGDNYKQLGDDRFVLENRGSKPTPQTIKKALRLSEDNIDDVGCRHGGLYPFKMYTRSKTRNRSRKHRQRRQDKKGEQSDKLDERGDYMASSRSQTMPNDVCVGPTLSSSCQLPVLVEEARESRDDMPIVAPPIHTCLSVDDELDDEENTKINFFDCFGVKTVSGQIFNDNSENAVSTNMLVNEVPIVGNFNQESVKTVEIECSEFHQAIGYEVFEKKIEEEQKYLYKLFSPEKKKYQRFDSEGVIITLQSICKCLPAIVQIESEEKEASDFFSNKVIPRTSQPQQVPSFSAESFFSLSSRSCENVDIR